MSAPSEYVGNDGAGVFTQTGGTNQVTTTLYLGSNAGSNGTYYLDGGLLIVPAITMGSGASTFSFGGGTLQASSSFATTLPMTLTGNGGNATVNTAGCSVTFSGSLSRPGGLTKTGAGTLTLTGSNSYGGDTTVSTGILQAKRTGSLPEL